MIASSGKASGAGLHGDHRAFSASETRMPAAMGGEICPPFPLTPAAARRAVTLLEVLLVLTVLALLGAVAWPSLDRSLADQRLRHAADMIRAEWAQAHVQAVATGMQQHFRFEPQGRRFWIEPAEQAESDLPGVLDVSSPAAQVPTGQRLLPDDVTFGEATVEPPSRTEVSWPMGYQDDNSFGRTESMQPEGAVVFYPDGTSSSASLVLRNTYDQCVAVSLRGLTAVATVGEVVPVEEVLP